jgi:uncharacterized membrane protein (DUF4010 family)
MMPFPPTEIALRIVLALAIGLVVGLERQWAHKELGARTFALTALLGMLSWMVGPGFALAALAGLFVLVAFANLRSLLADRTLETTTSVALLVTLVLGALVGQGHYFTAVSGALLCTGLLAWKTELARLAGDLTLGEIRGGVLLGLIAFVVYPLLPNRYVDRWELLNPRQAWVTIIVLAGIAFLNYVLLRVYSGRGVYFSAVLGGLVNSTATVVELGRLVGGEQGQAMATAVLLSAAAMLVRNLLLLAVLAPVTALWAAGPMLAMAAVALAFGWRLRQPLPAASPRLALSSPVSLRRVLGLGSIFVLIEVAGTLAARHAGSSGFLAVSLVGGSVSSASTTAAAAALTAAGRLGVLTAATATAIASITSLLVNLMLARNAAARPVRRQLTAATLASVAAGLAALILVSRP